MPQVRAVRHLRARERAILLVGLLLLLLLSFRASPFSLTAVVAPNRLATAACPASPLADDVLVVLRTGATEALEKLPVHFRTTLRCIPHFVIYSDFEEDIEGHHVHDVLTDVSDKFKTTMVEFSLYNQLHASGRKDLNYETTFGSGPEGAVGNLGWKLDKWKFLPMVERALQQKPRAKWFVFIESDTYLMWQNTLEYLSLFDPGRPHYFGRHMQVGEIIFAHGGSGFVLSRPAMEMLILHWKLHKEEFEELTAREWAGDAVLGKAMQDIGINLFWSYPHLQGDSVTSIDWNVSKLDREPWCYAPMTFHHMGLDEFDMLWQFEQDWLRESRASGGVSSPRFRDVFNGVIYPRLQSDKDGWDNISTGREYSEKALANLSKKKRKRMSTRELEAHLSFRKCQAACADKPGCIQFSYTAGRCSTSKVLRFGHAGTMQCLEYSDAAGKCVREGTAKVTPSMHGVPTVAAPVRSGWILGRVVDYVDKLGETCMNLQGRDWVTTNVI